MADNLSFNGKIQVQMDKLISDLHKAITETAEFAEKANLSSKATDRLEKSLLGLANSATALNRAMASGASSGRAQTTQLQAQQRQVQSLVAQYDQLRRTEGARSTVGSGTNEEIARRVILERDHGRAIQENIRHQDNYHASLSSTRYALYDVAQTWGLISAATLGAAVAAQAVAAQYESILSQVQRTSQTSGDAFGQLSEDLINLSTSMPTSFSDIGGIATLAGQLGIASDSISEFTSIVAKFSATTDVTAQAAATNIGRVAQLTGTASSEYENLASAIYQTGITSVATESAILSTATQISTAADLAGFANTEIIALASAFASLGVAPERARGSVQRIFGDIESASADGGEKLDKFAATAGMSADAFASAWKSSPQEALNQFLEGLARLEEQGESTDMALKDIGFVNVRDRQSIQVLANNMDVYTEAQEQSNSAYADGTALANGYALIADDLISKLKALGNTAMAIVNGIGNMPGVKLAVDALQQIANALLNFVRVPAVGFVGGLMVALAGLVGVFAAFQGALALGRASVIGLVQVQRAMATTTVANVTTLRSLAATLGTVAIGHQRATAASAAYSASLGVQTGAAARATASLAATRAMSTGLVAGLAGAAKFGAIGLGIAAVGFAVSALGDAFQSAQSKADEFFEGAQGLSEALRADTRAGKDAEGVVSTFSAKVATSTTTLNDNVAALGDALGTQIALSDSTATTTEGLKSQTYVVGQNTKEWALNALTTGEAGKAMTDWYTNFGAAMEGVGGFKLQDAISAALDPGNGGSAEYIDAQIAQYEAVIQKIEDVTLATGTVTDAQNKQRTAAYDNIAGFKELQTILGNTTTALESAASKGEVMSAVGSALGMDMSALSDETADVAEAADTASSALSEMIDSTFGGPESIAAVEDALYGLGSSLRDNGNSFSTFSEGGRANLEALKKTISALAEQSNGDAAVFGASIGNLLTDLEGYGVDTQNELQFVHQLMAQIGSTTATGVVDVDTSTAQAKLNNLSAQMRSIAGVSSKNSIFEGILTPLRKSVGAQINETNKQIQSAKKPTLEVAQAGITMGDSMKNGFDKADRAAKKSAGNQKKAADQTKEALRTLADYASDIGGVVSRAFDIRFGAQQGEDDIASQYEKISKTASDAAEAIEDANQKIREIDAALGTLRASNKTLEYQLRVAIEYGDELRATEIRAKMGENNAEIAGLGNDRNGAVIDLNTAQQQASMSLIGNTTAARENRDTVLGLVQSYQKQIQTLASSGLSTDQLAQKTEELRADFVRQLTQLGYNRAEIERYSAGFDDLAAAIRNVPRNVTVSADVNPAQQAINEFMARNANRNLSVGLSASGGGVYQATGINVGSGGIQTPSIAARNIYGGAVSGIGGAINGLLNGFSHGGYTGAGGKDEVAGLVHKGEYVFSQDQVDQNTGLPYQNALSGMLPSQNVSNTTINQGSNAAIQLVEVVPNQIHELINGMSVTVLVDGKQLTGTVNATNANSSVRANA